MDTRLGIATGCMVLLALLPVGAALAATGSAHPLASVPSAAFTVSGWITDQLSFAPVPNVTVRASNGATTLTNATGFYALGLPKGATTISLTSVGYRPATFSLSVNSNIVNENRSLRPYTFAISGSVIDAGTNQGIAGAVVLLMPIGLSNRTSPNGAFRILSENGTFTLIASAPGYVTQSVTVTVQGQPVTDYFTLRAASGNSPFSITAPILLGIGTTLGAAVGIVSYLAIALREGERLRRRPQPLAGIPVSRSSLFRRRAPETNGNHVDRRRRRTP